MFDRTDPADLLALKTEVLTDPIAMGYVPDSTNAGVLKLLNDAANNVGGETGNVELTTGVLLSAMVPDDLDAQQVGDGERRYVEAFMNRDFGTVIEEWRTQIRSAFKLNSATVANIDALVRPLSRAEVLFGAGTTISRDDWFAARDS